MEQRKILKYFIQFSLFVSIFQRISSILFLKFAENFYIVFIGYFLFVKTAGKLSGPPYFNQIEKKRFQALLFNPLTVIKGRQGFRPEQDSLEKVNTATSV